LLYLALAHRVASGYTRKFIFAAPKGNTMFREEKEILNALRGKLAELRRFL
jgi:hypothetical protein